MTLSSRERTSVIIGLLAVLLFLGLHYVAFPLIDQRKTINDQMEVKASLLQQYQARLHMLPRLEQELESLQSRLEEAEHGLVKGLTPALGAARVQLILDDLSGQQKGIEIKNTRVLDAQEHGIYTKIAVRVALTAQTKSLTDFLYDIKHQSPYLSVSELIVRGSNQKKLRALRTDVVIEALMKQSPEQGMEPQPEPEAKSRNETA